MCSSDLLNIVQTATNSQQVREMMDKYPRDDSETDLEYGARILEERLARLIQKTGKWPSDHIDNGLWTRIKAFLNRVWRRINGYKSDLTDKQLRRVFQLLFTGGQRHVEKQFSFTNFGGGVRLLGSNVGYNSTAEEQAADVANSLLGGKINPKVREAYDALSENEQTVPIKDLFTASNLPQIGRAHV